ncbi:MAG: hypothetical protein JWO90_2824, partial [Solirubrobacterales bacterium]|nr:hypothetical protein [Solirubrobacterales bacterium]
MTLRLRLVLTLVLLAAGGLLVLGGVTYATQRDFQEERVDDQTRAAEPALSRQLDDVGALVPGAGPGRGRPGPDPDR